VPKFSPEATAFLEDLVNDFGMASALRVKEAITLSFASLIYGFAVAAAAAVEFEAVYSKGAGFPCMPTQHRPTREQLLLVALVLTLPLLQMAPLTLH
jgi:hypothetical protein